MKMDPPSTIRLQGLNSLGNLKVITTPTAHDHMICPIRRGAIPVVSKKRLISALDLVQLDIARKIFESHGVNLDP